jgi:hypothetical protein
MIISKLFSLWLLVNLLLLIFLNIKILNMLYSNYIHFILKLYSPHVGMNPVLKTEDSIVS